MSSGALIRILDRCYDRIVGTREKPGGAAQLAAEYSNPSRTLEENIQSLVRWQVAKCAATGFITGIGGFATLPVALPADLFANYYIQIRMIAAIALMCGHDLHSDRVKSLVYICLCGNAALDIVKDAGMQLGARSVETALAQATGRSAAALGKAVPLVGGVLCGALDAGTCKAVGYSAQSIFTSEKPQG